MISRWRWYDDTEMDGRMIRQFGGQDFVGSIGCIVHGDASSVRFFEQEANIDRSG